MNINGLTDDDVMLILFLAHFFFQKKKKLKIKNRRKETKPSHGKFGRIDFNFFFFFYKFQNKNRSDAHGVYDILFYNNDIINTRATRDGHSPKWRRITTLFTNYNKRNKTIIMLLLLNCWLRDTPRARWSVRRRRTMCDD